MFVTPNAIKGTTGSAPTTGAFTPNAASTGYRAWSIVPTGWWGLVRYEDGTAWELEYSYWNGTTLSRGTSQFVDSSTGSQLSLSSSATAALVIDGMEELQLNNRALEILAQPGNTTVNQIGAAPIATGTASSVALATTSFFTEQQKIQYASLTTANAQAGWSTGNYAMVDTTAGRGGAALTCVWGPSGLPTGPRIMVGLLRTTYVGVTTEPSAQLNFAAFAQDSTDTNIQFMVNDGSGTATKTDTGIAMSAATSWLVSTIVIDAGGGKVTGLLVRLDTGAIWYGTATTNIPATGTMQANLIGGLNGTNTGTAFNMCPQRLMLYTGSH